MPTLLLQEDDVILHKLIKLINHNCNKILERKEIVFHWLAEKNLHKILGILESANRSYKCLAFKCNHYCSNSRLNKADEE